MSDDEHDTERAERLAEVDAWLADLEPGCDGWYIQTRLVRWLRDEMERLREIAQAVVDAIPPLSRDMADDEFCDYCGAPWEGIEETAHTVECLITKSRALLA